MREDYWFLVGVVKDDSNGVTLPRAKPAHTVPKVDAIDSPRSLDRPMTHRERHGVALAERNHFWPRLHSRPLLGNPYKDLVSDLMERGVNFELCGATAKIHNWGNEDVLPGIKINTDAMARMTQLVQEGFVKISE